MPLSAYKPLTSAALGFLTFLIFLTSEFVVWLWSHAGNMPLLVQAAAHLVAIIFLLETVAVGLVGLEHALQALWQIRQRWRATFGRSK